MAALRAAADAGPLPLLRATAGPHPPNPYATTRDTNRSPDTRRRP